MRFIPILKYVLLGISAMLMLAWIFILPAGNVDALLYWCYGLLGLAVALIVVLPLANIIRNPKGAMRSIIGLSVLAALSVVFFSLGSQEPVVNSAGGFFDERFTLKISDMGLYLTYVALAATVVVVVWGEIRNSLK